MATSLVSGAVTCIASANPNASLRTSGVVSSSSISRFAVKPAVARFSTGRRFAISSKLESPSEVNSSDVNDGLQLATSSALAGMLFSSLANVGSAHAAQEVMELAASDNRGALVLAFILPALGWVLFNIAGPAQNQFSKLLGTPAAKKRSIAGALGLGGASLLLAPQADAAEEIMQLAAADNRGALVLAFILPALGWVLFNIAGPAQNQLNNLLGSSAAKKRSVAGVLGLGGASLLLAPQAEAAEEIMQLAASDNRGLLVIAFILPALGWVLFNIAGPALNQWNKLIGSGGKTKKK